MILCFREENSPPTMRAVSWAAYRAGRTSIVKAAVKPIASIPQEQRTIDIDGKPVSITIGGRHDLSAIPRCVPVHRAMVSLVLADAVLLQRRLGRGL